LPYKASSCLPLKHFIVTDIFSETIVDTDSPDGQGFVIVDNEDVGIYHSEEVLPQRLETSRKSGNGYSLPIVSLVQANTRSISMLIYKEPGSGYSRCMHTSNGTTLPNTDSFRIVLMQDIYPHTEEVLTCLAGETKHKRVRRRSRDKAYSIKDLPARLTFSTKIPKLSWKLQLMVMHGRRKALANLFHH
jgi:hypothetical protein